MTENPYKTPEADFEPTENEISPHSKFYIVSITKFTILFFSTLGFYSIYWFYKNWKQHKLSTFSNISPIARAIFNIFFTHKLFAEIQNNLIVQEKTFKWSPDSLATTFVALSIVSNILDRLASEEILSPYSDLASLIIFPFLYLALVKAQKAINFCLDDTEGLTNNSFTIGNYIWILLGLLAWALVLLGFLTMFGVVDI